MVSKIFIGVAILLASAAVFLHWNAMQLYSLEETRYNDGRKSRPTSNSNDVTKNASVWVSEIASPNLKTWKSGTALESYERLDRGEQAQRSKIRSRFGLFLRSLRVPRGDVERIEAAISEVNDDINSYDLVARSNYLNKAIPADLQDQIVNHLRGELQRSLTPEQLDSFILHLRGESCTTMAADLIAKTYTIGNPVSSAQADSIFQILTSARSPAADPIEPAMLPWDEILPRIKAMLSEEQYAAFTAVLSKMKYDANYRAITGRVASGRLPGL